jgi:formylglycine-generating enzyme required for sulfatase activity
LSNAGLVQVPGTKIWMDRTEVTNAQFAEFVRATGYRTEAEVAGRSAVFRVPTGGSTREGEWWQLVDGANWLHPDGPASDLGQRANLPVVHVTVGDALAYASWLGRDLPTEAEWELAAYAGGDSERIGRQPRDADGRPSANYFQGLFPDLDLREDGYAGLAPVGCFTANGYGLNDMIGNAWELTRSPFDRRRDEVAIRGGSFLCSEDYCSMYRASARQAQDRRGSTSHVSFRTVLRMDDKSD